MTAAPEPPLATSLGLLTWRPRTDEDQGLLRALFASSRRAELDLLGADPDQERTFVDLQLRARDAHRDATRPDAELAIVTLDGVAVGQLDLHRTDAAVEILEIALVPGLRSHGLGTVVLRRVLDDAGDLPVRLHVEPANPARHLYARLGFATTGTDGLHLAMERPASGGGGPAPTTAPAAVAPTGPGGGAPVDGPPVPTYDDLAGHIGATVACLPDGPDLELVAVDARPRPGQPGRVPYSALLAGPLDQPLAQGVVGLDLPGTGPTELFIVPLGPADGRAIYELVVA